MFLIGCEEALTGPCFRARRRGRGKRSSRLRRLDDCVNVTALGGDVGIGETFAELGDFLAPQTLAVRFGRAINFAFIHDAHGAFGTHDGNFRSGPGKIRVGANVLAGHDAICAAVSLPSNHR